MEEKLNILEIQKNNYVVPFYQRNFSWGEDEIELLLRDIYESFKKNINSYYIGSLVVRKRLDGKYEVIDGQQRLTVIMLISIILGILDGDPYLDYDSRSEVKEFFYNYYKYRNLNNIKIEHNISHLANAIDYINEANLNTDNNNKITIDNLGDDYELFKYYFSNNVVIIFVELPKDTDVAKYFEIMNNRGQQLKKHEILKAKLLERLKTNHNNPDRRKQKIYSKIWNACSQMNTHIQKLFEKNDRRILFGKEFNQIPSKENIKKLLEQEDYIPINSNKLNNNLEDTLEYIINSKNNSNNQEIINWTIDIADDNDNEGDDKSIIDFPNFLMHILKLKYSSNLIDIPLNEKHLLDTYDDIKDVINTEDFISDLLYYRTIFDRYIIKTTTDEKSEDKFKWTLQQPWNNKKSLDYKPTFNENEYKGKQEEVIKCLSMLQVTFRTRIYKNWLQEILTWFKNDDNNIVEEDYEKRLNGYLLEYYKRNIEVDNLITIDYAKGTNTPHFIFNFIDYLYWKNNKKNNRFDYRYRNSVEHHLPQSKINKKKEYTKELIDNIGNLCLVSKNLNSLMNREHPEGKAKNYYNDKLTPKRKKMYDMTNNYKSWEKNEILEHCREIVYLLENRVRILN